MKFEWDGSYRGAIFSQNRHYRYVLWRVWNPTKPWLSYTGLNPSKANAMLDDPTVTVMMARGAREGFGAVWFTNLYGYVSSDPKILLLDLPDFVGENDDYLEAVVGLTQRHLIGWGAFSAAARRSEAVLKIIPEPYCLGVNKGGQPKHPLYVPYKEMMRPYQKIERSL